MRATRFRRCSAGCLFTALAHRAELVTSDQAFSGLPGVTLL